MQPFAPPIEIPRDELVAILRHAGFGQITPTNADRLASYIAWLEEQHRQYVEQQTRTLMGVITILQEGTLQ